MRRLLLLLLAPLVAAQDAPTGPYVRCVAADCTWPRWITDDGSTLIFSKPITTGSTALTASRLVVSDASKNFASNGAITTNALAKSASSGATLSASTVTDDGTIVTVNTASTFRTTSTTNSLSANAFNITATMPTTLTGNTFGSVSNITGAGSSSFNGILGSHLGWMKAGYTGAQTTTGAWFLNSSAGTGAAPFGADTTALGNSGILAQASSSTAGSNQGIITYCSNSGAGSCYGGAFTADSGGTTSAVAGVNLGGTTRNGGVFSIGSPTVLASAVQANNGSVAIPIIVAQDNGAALPTSGATATWQIADGAWPQVGNGVLTSGTMTPEVQARECGGGLCHSYLWTNAMVSALPASAGDISVATLPAKTVVTNAYVTITGQAAGPTTVTVACGRTSALYIDYIVASDAKAAANTVYGDVSGERGTNLTGYDLPSYTGTTAVNCHFISTGGTLSTVTGSTGRVILQTALVP